MFSKRMSLFVVGASIALVALILFQVHWMYQSQKLVEEQFDQKVGMALCSAMDQISQEQKQATPPLSLPLQGTLIQTSCSSPPVDLATLDRAVSLAMERFGIALDFEIKVAENGDSLPFCRKAYCTPLDPLQLSPQTLHLDFIGKREYVIQQLGPMAISSVIVLLFVSTFFVLALIKLAQQKKLNRENTDFFDNMAHEFRTPLANIQLALRLWEKRKPDLSSNRYHKIIQQESRHLLDQVDKILTFSQVKQSAYPFERVPLHLEAFLEEVVQHSEPWVEARGGNLHLIHNQEPMPAIQMDPLHLRNVIRNLLDNALKYGENGTIELRYGLEDKYAFCSVWNDGVPLELASFQQILAKYQRSVPAQYCREDGFGLGLFYIQQVMAQHAGYLRLGDRKANGTEFQLLFPLSS
ncbi:MAG: HAMP domain-containing sensor histidine kinase [Bacteroidota bacterium]